MCNLIVLNEIVKAPTFLQKGKLGKIFSWGAPAYNSVWAESAWVELVSVQGLYWRHIIIIIIINCYYWFIIVIIVF